MTIYFTADLHLGHKNIIEYSNRPFSSIEEMDATLIGNWNKTVNDNDEIYVLGDITFYMPKRAIPLVASLKGRKHLIPGNHDKYLIKDKSFTSLFESVADFGKTIKIQDTDANQGVQRIVLCHYPLLTWEKAHFQTWNLHGHCHGSLKDDPTALRLDIGVDAWTENNIIGYKPVSYEDIKKRMSTKNWKPIDHHTYRE